MEDNYNPHRKRNGHAKAGWGSHAYGGRYGEWSGDFDDWPWKKKRKTVEIEFENSAGTTIKMRTLFIRWEVSHLSDIAGELIWVAAFFNVDVPEFMLSPETLKKLPPFPKEDRRRLFP